ncbi:hypothetical protein HDF16_006218 [Granulicella aggregans]|uniref:Lipoprotein n=1 Tax=Granulicella aggregans TaxID=474949 RepID=A0A7W7ZKK7_9BACT|nr:hypothetical protein [Granulicella aggregans]MBB5061482.1 hypothetical protein [Granulicella aggregans]
MKSVFFCLCVGIPLACCSIATPTIGQGPSAQIPTYRSGLKSIAIPSPTSDLNEVGSDYRVLLEHLAPDTNRLIAGYVLADDAANLRGEVPKGASRYALVETLRRAEFAEVDATSFKQMSATLAQQYGTGQNNPQTDLKPLQDELNHKLKALGSANEVALDKPVQLGAFFTRPDAYCFGMISPISSGESSINMVTAVIVLRVQNRLLYAYVSARYAGDESVRWTRSTSEQWTDAILKANQ